MVARALSSGESYKCKRCNEQVYGAPGDHSLCADCEDTWRATQRRFEAAHLPRLHSGRSSWDTLLANPPYTPMDAYRAAVREFAASQHAFVAIIGRRGTGKTQIATTAISERIRKGRWGRYTTAINLMGDFINRPTEDNAWRAEWSSYPYLVIDELHQTLRTEAQRTQFESLMDERYMATRVTVLIANEDLKGFQELVGPSVCRRIDEAGAILECNWTPIR